MITGNKLCTLYCVKFTEFSVVSLESFTFTRTPRDPKIVVEGVSVSLVWTYKLESNERIQEVSFRRQKSGQMETRIATSTRGSSIFVFNRKEFTAAYIARRSSRSATLVVRNVNSNEEYTYSLKVKYSDGVRSKYPRSSVSVIVVGKYCVFILYIYILNFLSVG